ncbi:hypothetical protein BU24DRAFT_457978 [Aaosphaeria arxii CBS 175.79]|uniref:Uncharacterized protein n=1 Tax=Aaosphaeria arxii CBS 175.79 TaxID=1450172 RepID=A0A6A5YA36_9PLEO|nr:uncharacterized protein BU24DRAFT_457978 [Aaosphaeria arxii CBS 175.79]KAF2022083.1 hypothetical protein BU24DRAFT_457978 [Aaosphaeria arxii CBS 175.79]
MPLSAQLISWRKFRAYQARMKTGQVSLIVKSHNPDELSSKALWSDEITFGITSSRATQKNHRILLEWIEQQRKTMHPAKNIQTSNSEADPQHRRDIETAKRKREENASSDLDDGTRDSKIRRHTQVENMPLKDSEAVTSANLSASISTKC